MTVLATERLILRPWQEHDLEPFARLNQDPRVMEYFPSLLSRGESDRTVDRINAHFATYGWGLWAADLQGTFIGFIGLSHVTFTAPFTPAVEVGWRLAHEFWGKGYATEGARAALAFGFKAVGLSEIVSFTAVANKRSRRVMERLGMHHNGKDDFDHPRLDAASPLRRHVLYRLRGEEFNEFPNRDRALV